MKSFSTSGAGLPSWQLRQSSTSIAPLAWYGIVEETRWKVDLDGIPAFLLTSSGLRVPVQVAVVYVPVLQKAFSTTGLSAGDWALCTAVASAVLWLREASKLLRRLRGRLRPRAVTA